MAEPEGFADTFVLLYRQIHDELRLEVSALDPQALNWVPGPDTSSISTLVVHLLGSENEVLQIVRGLLSDRDHASEFSAQHLAQLQLTKQLFDEAHDSEAPDG